MKDLSENIVKYRGQAGMTQRRLANLVPCSASAIAQFEHGLKVPSAKMLARIAAVLEITPNDLLGIREKGDGEDDD